MKAPTFEVNSQSTDSAQDRIFSILFTEDDITWQNIIYDLVRREGMNPWDIDVSEISHKFLQMLKKLKEMDFRISGKVVLASAILLKIKSNRLIEEDISALDALMSSVDEPESLLDELQMDETAQGMAKDASPRLMPKTPQPRKRKVSVYDLIKALEKALEVEVRRPPVYVPPKFKMTVPVKSFDVGEMMNDVYGKVTGHYSSTGSSNVLKFSQLVPSDSKDDKVFTFIPLLHLENQRKVDMHQDSHFGEIEIALAIAASPIMPALEQASSVEINPIIIRGNNFSNKKNSESNKKE